eukprot:11029685-Lingulodinium_polyedra.AAC.1
MTCSNARHAILVAREEAVQQGCRSGGHAKMHCCCPCCPSWSYRAVQVCWIARPGARTGPWARLGAGPGRGATCPRNYCLVPL